VIRLPDNIFFPKKEKVIWPGSGIWISQQKLQAADLTTTEVNSICKKLAKEQMDAINL
jgi:hypothetical protein